MSRSSSVSPHSGVGDSTDLCCRSDSPSVVRWLETHEPDQREVLLPYHVSRIGGLGETSKEAPAAARLYNSEEEARSREQMNSVASTLHSLASSSDVPSDSVLQDLEEALTFEYSRTLVCQAPRAMLWKAMKRKIKQPEAFSCVKNVKITYEGTDIVYRQMEVGQVGGGNGEGKSHSAAQAAAIEHTAAASASAASSSSSSSSSSVSPRDLISEKITWDESSESVRFTLYDDPRKEGWIENAIALDAAGQVCLNVSCHWTFLPHPGVTAQALLEWRSRLRRALDNGCAQTVKLVEEEARQITKEQRRRSSASQSREEASMAQQAHMEKERAQQQQVEKKDKYDEKERTSSSSNNSNRNNNNNNNNNNQLQQDSRSPRLIQVATKGESK